MLAHLLLAAMLWSPPSGPDPQSRVLKTSELETILRGAWIIDAHIPYSYCCYPEMFHRYGEYVRHSDNFEAHGTYRFKGDEVCVVAEQEEELCRRVMVDSRGRYWISRSHRPNSYKLIAISPLKD